MNAVRRASAWALPPRPRFVGEDLSRLLRESAAALERLANITDYAMTREDVLAIAAEAHGVAAPLAFQLDLLLGRRPSVAGARAYARENVN